MQIRIAELVGRIAVTSEDGDAVRSLIEKTLKQGEVAELDFSGVAVFASPFFNAAIGRLLATHSPEDLRGVLKQSNLSRDAEQTLERVVKNAREFYSNERTRTVVEKLANEDFEGC